ncbi:maleylpyruvate isomerase family mycothiol-dependent enzyme [Streptomyces sp. NPDC002574]|uniref:maleylpyruvate isomerase family mycothiol-dependent enzyme n=1 Tax=Streptomyces sp. NPDC002574 TaxID=3364652 RepID=UPI00367F0447
MTSVPPQVTAAVHATAERIAELLRPCADASVRIPGAQWTVGEAAAHLVLANELMAALAGGDDRPYGDGTAGSLAAANAASLEAYPERDPAVLAEGVVRHAKAFTEAAAGRPAEQPVLTPLGPMDLATLGSYLVAHMLGHGWDIAAALRRPHMIDAAAVEATVPFVMTAMPRVLSAAADGHTACYDLRVRGGSRFAVTFSGGAAEVTPELPGRADVTIVAEPVTFLLIALGRRTATGAVARGKILAWGRKPWLAPAFPSLFTAP